MTRAVPTWTGKTDDAPIPKAVRARVFLASGGRCALSGRPIRPGDDWHCDHIIALANGGRHAEDNLQAVLAEHHREKTKADVKVTAKIRRVRMKHLGLKPKSKAWGNRSRKFDNTVGPTKRALREGIEK